MLKNQFGSTKLTIIIEVLVKTIFIEFNLNATIKCIN